MRNTVLNRFRCGQFLEITYCYNKKICANIRYCFALFIGHKSSFRREACNVETRYAIEALGP